MIKSLFTAATGMHAQQLNIDVIANNLANVNTTGFKKGRVDFQDLMYQYIREPGSPTSQTTNNTTGIQVGLGVKPEAAGKIFTQGDLTSTNNQLDLAIEGDGFFQITKPDGNPAYTRSGAFKLDENGQMVTSDGFLIEPTITIPTTAVSITIAQDGTVSILEPSATAPTSVGQIQLVRFANPAGLKAAGQNLYLETQASGTPNTGNPSEEGYGRITQGFLESSNVTVVEEVVRMILAERAYQTNSKAIEASDNMLQQAINLKR